MKSKITETTELEVYVRAVTEGEEVQNTATNKIQKKVSANFHTHA